MPPPVAARRPRPHRGASATAARPPWGKWLPIRLVAPTPRRASFRVTIDSTPASRSGAVTHRRPDTAVRSPRSPPRPDFAITEPPATGRHRRHRRGRHRRGGTGTGDSSEAARFRQAHDPRSAARSGARARPAARRRARHPGAARRPWSPGSSRRSPCRPACSRSSTSARGSAGSRRTRSSRSWPRRRSRSRCTRRCATCRQTTSCPASSRSRRTRSACCSANHAFIEAYMVGLNHEMARQLLWAGYPTDLRGQLLPAVLGRQRLRAASPVTRPTRRSWPSCSRTSRRSTPGRLPCRSAATRTGPASCRTTSCCSSGANCCAATPTRSSTRPRPSWTAAQRVIDAHRRAVSALRAARCPPTSPSSASTCQRTTPRAAPRPRPQGFFFVFQQHPTEPRFGLEPSADGTVHALGRPGLDQLRRPAAAAPGPGVPARHGGDGVLQQRLGAVATGLDDVRERARRHRAASTSSPRRHTPRASRSPTTPPTRTTPRTRGAPTLPRPPTSPCACPIRVAIHADLMVPS